MKRELILASRRAGESFWNVAIFRFASRLRILMKH